MCCQSSPWRSQRHQRFDHAGLHAVAHAAATIPMPAVLCFSAGMCRPVHVPMQDAVLRSQVHCHVSLTIAGSDHLTIAGSDPVRLAEVWGGAEPGAPAPANGAPKWNPLPQRDGTASGDGRSSGGPGPAGKGIAVGDAGHAASGCLGAAANEGGRAAAAEPKPPSPLEFKLPGDLEGGGGFGVAAGGAAEGGAAVAGGGFGL